MIKIKIRKINEDSIVKNLKGLGKALNDIKLTIGDSIAEDLKESLINKISSIGSGEWLKLYKEAINFSYSNGRWVITGEREISADFLDADKNLIIFGNTDAASSVLANYNPWPLDLIPALSRSYSKITVRLDSESNIEAQRKRILSKWPEIKRKLQEKGYNITEYSLPKFEGKIVADLGALAKQLEFGLGPFQKQPVWQKTVSELTGKLTDITKKLNLDLENTLKNGRSKVREISPELKDMLANAKIIKINK